MDDHDFKAGTAQVDITPPLGTLINGDFITHYAREVHDPLFAKAIVLQNKGNILVFVVVDVCAMRKDFIDGVKASIYQESGILPENIMISATHTHAGASVESLLLGHADLSYRQKLKELILEVVLQARQNLRPAKIAFGAVKVPEHVVCRRYFMQEGYEARNPVTGSLDKVKTNPMGDENAIVKRKGIEDAEVSYMAIKGTDEKWIGMLANYSLHYVGDWENGMITADYFGVFARQIRVMLEASENFVAIMSNGTSGDINIVDFLQPDRYPKKPFEKSRLIGKDIAEKVVRSMSSLIWEEDPVLKVRYKELMIHTRKPSTEDVKAAARSISEFHFENLSMKESSHTGNDEIFRMIYSREQVLLNEYPESIPFPIQIFKVGSYLIGGLGGEFFAETGLWLKEHINKGQYFTVGMANDYVGYVPPEHEFIAGGYETWRCRSSFLCENAEEDIRMKMLEMSNEAIRK